MGAHTLDVADVRLREAKDDLRSLASPTNPQVKSLITSGTARLLEIINFLFRVTNIKPTSFDMVEFRADSNSKLEIL